MLFHRAEFFQIFKNALRFLFVDQVVDISKTINGQGTTILVVEQNAAVALSIAHRGYVLQNGRIVIADSAAALLGADAVRSAYLGEV